MTSASFFARPNGFRPPARRLRQAGIAAATLWLAAALATPAAARCIPVAQQLDAPPVARLWTVQDRAPAETENTARGPALAPGIVELTFLAHSSFLIRTHENATAITDYNGYHRAPYAPDIVTMNHAHNTHYTDDVEPGVKHILRGWKQNGVIPQYDVTVRDLRVTNVPTNIREGAVDDGVAGNSIFVFESAGLCIVHLGHLHHRLRSGHAGKVGSVDILLAPIDDGYTMPQRLLVQVIDQLKPQVVIPMHYGYGGTLGRFVARMTERKFDIRRTNSPTASFAKVSLPARQTVVVLQGRGY